MPSLAIFSEEPYYTFADENGNFLLNNIPHGVYDVVVNLDGTHHTNRDSCTRICAENLTDTILYLLFILPTFSHTHPHKRDL
jgi:hypothetical protein